MKNVLAPKFSAVLAAGAVFFLLGSISSTIKAFPVGGEQTALPAGSDLNEDALAKPREIFKSEVHNGRKSYLVNLGDLAFNSPLLLGGIARRANMSCGTCHTNGAANAGLFVPGLSSKPGTIDTNGALFFPKADDKIFNPKRIPSLRGERYLAPYGQDGRIASLREFVREVIVDEFDGPEPAPKILDAIATYINDIDFLPNPQLGPAGRLTQQASDAARRGEALFNRPFPQNPALSCAACHDPTGAFVDHRQHDVGSGGLFKTPTLRNANVNAPYFHDGRFESYGQVVAYFDHFFSLGLKAEEQADLVAYLSAVGDGLMPLERQNSAVHIREMNDFLSVLEVAIPAHDKDVIVLSVDTVIRELRELTEDFPDHKDTAVPDGLAERRTARLALKETVLLLRRLNADAAGDRFEEAAADYKLVRNMMVGAIPANMLKAEAWSLFNPDIHKKHYAALGRMLDAAGTAHPLAPEKKQ